MSNPPDNATVEVWRCPSCGSAAATRESVFHRFGCKVPGAERSTLYTEQYVEGEERRHGVTRRALLDAEKQVEGLREELNGWFESNAERRADLEAAEKRVEELTEDRDAIREERNRALRGRLDAEQEVTALTEAAREALATNDIAALAKLGALAGADDA